MIHWGPKYYTSGGGAARLLKIAGPVGAIAGGAIAAGPAIRGAVQTRDNADRFVQGFENKFGAELARISQLGSTDPQAALSQLEQAWAAFEGAANSYIQRGGQDATVAQQALRNPKLIGTVRQMFADLGGSFNPGTIQVGGGKYGLTFEDWLRLAGETIRTTQGSGSSGSTGNTSGAPSPTDTGTDDPGVHGGGGAVPPGIPGGGGGGNGSDNGFMDQLMRYLIPGAAVAGALYDFTAGAGAAKEAAQIQADAAREAARLDREAAAEATQLFRDIYNQDRTDKLPHINTGNRSVLRLSHLMGLDEDPTAQPAQDRMAQPLPLPGPPGVRTSTRAPLRRLPSGMSFDEAAAMYQRGGR